MHILCRSYVEDQGLEAFDVKNTRKSLAKTQRRDEGRPKYQRPKTLPRKLPRDVSRNKIPKALAHGRSTTECLPRTLTSIAQEPESSDGSIEDIEREREDFEEATAGPSSTGRPPSTEAGEHVSEPGEDVSGPASLCIGGCGQPRDWCEGCACICEASFVLAGARTLPYRRLLLSV